MNRKLIQFIIANIFAVNFAAAAEETPAADSDGFVWSGEISAGGVGTNDKIDYRSVTNGPATQDGAKLNEYRDLRRAGPTGTFDIRGRGDRYYLNAFGENLDRNDQYLNLQGGMYDVFKYRLYDDRMVHNESWNLLTPFSGAGGSVLTMRAGATGLAGGSDSNPNTWNLYDASLKKENLGGAFEFSKNSPWYFRADANQMTTKGIQLASSSVTFSAGNGSIDLPMPVDYKTQSYSIETGFSNKRGLINVNFSQSFFTNGNETYSWMDPRFSNGLTTNTEAANSKLSKIGVNGTLRQLPFNSTLTSRISYSQLTNSIGLDGGYITNTTAAGPTITTSRPDIGRFDGNILTSNGSLALTSNPVKMIDTRVFYNWYYRQNRSPMVNFSGQGGLNAEGYNYGRFGYRKNNFGLDLGVRLNADNKVSVGVSQMAVDRTPMGPRPIFEPSSTIDNTYYVEYKNSTFDVITPRARYERVNRMSGDWNESINASNAQNPAYSRPFDTANYHQDRAKLAFDATPFSLVDISAQAIYKMTKYDASNYGLKSDNRQEVDVTISYGDPNLFRATLFADYEQINYIDYWYVGGLQGPTSAANFNLQSSARNANKMIGLAGDWPVNEKFKMNASYMYMRTTGTVDFLSNAVAPAAGFFATTGGYAGGIMPYVTDNATKQSISLTGKYTLNKNWSLTGAYAYEKYSIRDDQMYGWGGLYNYFPVMSATLVSSFSGANQNPSYTAQIFRLMATYKF